MSIRRVDVTVFHSAASGGWGGRADRDPLALAIEDALYDDNSGSGWGYLVYLNGDELLVGGGNRETGEIIQRRYLLDHDLASTIAEMRDLERNERFAVDWPGLAVLMDDEAQSVRLVDDWARPLGRMDESVAGMHRSEDGQ